MRDKKSRGSMMIYPDLTNAEKILVIKLRNLGDVLLTTPIFSILKKHFPKASVDAYVNHESLPLLEGNPYIDEIISYNRKWKKEFLLKRLYLEYKLLSKFKKKRYDLVINLTEGDRGAICAKHSKAPIKVGFDSGKKGLFGKDKIYTHLVKKPHLPRHNVELNLDALRRIGIFPQKEEKELFFPLEKTTKEKMQSILEKKGVEEFYLIHPGARWKFKCWEEEKFQQLIKKLLSEDKKVIVTCSNEQEECAMINRIVEGICSDHLIAFKGDLTIKELGALVSLCTLCFCMDSLVLHIASAFKKKTVVLFGPTSEEKWGPWHNNEAIVLTRQISCRPCYMDGCGGSKKSQCLQEIELEQVLDAFNRLENQLLLI